MSHLNYRQRGPSNRRASEPTLPHATVPPRHSCHTLTLTRLRHAPSRRPTTSVSLTHVRNATAIRLRDDIDFTSAIGAHIQSSLSIPRQTHRSEATFWTARKIKVGHDICGGYGAICRFTGRAVAVEFNKAEFVADGRLAVPDVVSTKMT
jgi:hypothetical protein